LILDGEVAIFDDKLVSRFEWMRHGKPPGVATPPMFMAFDCVYQDGIDLRPRELRARRDVLERVIADQQLVLPVRRLASDGLKAWQEVVERGYEGYVAKDEASLYAGGRTLRWVKVKQAEYPRRRARLEPGRGSVLEAALGRLHPVEDLAPLRLVLVLGDQPPVPQGLEFAQAVSGAAAGRS
jgi:ATP-dependent DNA ligase